MDYTLDAARKRLTRVEKILLENLSLRERKYRLEEAERLMDAFFENEHALLMADGLASPDLFFYQQKGMNKP